ncbi:tyrosine-type recombinase/integrase [Pasteurellaceae bacterium TAE3-ERU1]|nr:tyrosine-type recombinase/integrase [Pasteurellaceae bacterium TAE3-ERU1]
MSVRKDKSKGKWLAEFYQGDKRVRRWFATRKEADGFFALNNPAFQSETALSVAEPDADYQPKPKNEHKPLSHYVQLWYDLHGQTLSDGEQRLAKLLNVCQHLGDPFAHEFDAEVFAEYRRHRLAGKFSANPKRPPKQTTVNREHAYLRAVFNELSRLGKWDGDNPLKGVRQFRESETALAFLEADEIRRLLAECDRSRNPDLGMIVRVCLATGARWSEAESLTGAQVSNQRITFVHTKSKRNRTVPISAELFAMLPKRRGRLFGDAYEAFSNAVQRAEIDLPKGQLTHVLRHTFASHFMMNGGNLLVLKEILGHSTVEMTMRYAHFSPTHLESAVSLNPLQGIK